MGNCKAKKEIDSAEIDEIRNSDLSDLAKAKKFEHTGCYREAIKLYKKVIKETGPNTEAYNGLGNVSTYKKQYFDAIEYYEKALQIDINDKYAYNGLGNTYDIIQKDEQSLSCYKRSIKIDPNFSFPRNGLANLYYDRKQFRQALVEYKEAERLEKDNPLIHANIACCLIFLQNFQESFEHFFKAKTLAENKEHLSMPNKIYLKQRLTQFQKQLDQAGGAQKKKFAELMQKKYDNLNAEDQANQRGVTALMAA